MEATSNNQTSIFLSLVGIILAIIIFIVVSTLGYIIFTLFDDVRGLGESKLQAVFREIVCPTVGGFAAMYFTVSWLKNINLRILFYGFAVMLVVYAVFYLGVVVPVAKEIEVSVWDTILALLSILAGGFGAYYCVSDRIKAS